MWAIPRITTRLRRELTRRMPTTADIRPRFAPTRPERAYLPTIMPWVPYNNNGFVGPYWRTAKTGDPTTTLPVDWPPVPLSQANPIEGDFWNAGTDDPSFWSFEGVRNPESTIDKSYSTNGLAMYTASNFNEAMKGHLLAVSFNNTSLRNTSQRKRYHQQPSGRHQ